MLCLGIWEKLHQHSMYLHNAETHTIFTVETLSSHISLYTDLEFIICISRFFSCIVIYRLENRMERLNTTGHIVDIASVSDRMREELSSTSTSQVTKLKKIARRPILVRSDFSLGMQSHTNSYIYWLTGLCILSVIKCEDQWRVLSICSSYTTDWLWYILRYTTNIHVRQTVSAYVSEANSPFLKV